MTLWAREEEGPGERERGLVMSAPEWYQSEKISLFSVTEEKRKFHHAIEKR